MAPELFVTFKSSRGLDHTGGVGLASMPALARRGGAHRAIGLAGTSQGRALCIDAFHLLTLLFNLR